MYIIAIIEFIAFSAANLVNIVNTEISKVDQTVSLLVGICYLILAVFAVKGEQLNVRRKEFREADKTQYIPDSYGLLLLFYFCIVYGSVTVYNSILTNIANNTSIVSTISEAIVSSIIYAAIIIFVKKKHSATVIYDPLSKKYNPPKKEEQDAPHDGCIPLYRNILSFEDAKDNVLALVINPAGDSTTFCVKSPDDSMEGFGIQIGSIVYFKGSEKVLVGDIVAAIIGNQILIRRITKLEDGKISLEATNNSFPPMVFENATQIQLMGVASAVFKKFPDQSEEA